MPSLKTAPPDDNLILKSQYPVQGIIWNPVNESKTFYHYTYKDEKKKKVLTAHSDFFYLVEHHQIIHGSILCELCLTLRKFKQARGMEI